jgi:hypothetical protein
MTSPVQDSAARPGAFGQDTDLEPVLAPACGPAPQLPSRPSPAEVPAAKCVPPDPDTLRRVKAALDRL